MILNLMRKEFKLSLHITSFLFLAFGLMLLIPSYPYYVAFVYTCLAVFFTFLNCRENHDIFFSSTLPVKKSDIVLARCLSVAAIQSLSVLIAVPFGIIGARINPNGENPVGIEANVAFFGFVLIMLGLFNLIYFPNFYKTGYNIGKPLILASIPVTIFVVAAEVVVQAVPSLKTVLDTNEPAFLVKQIPVLAAGIVFYILSLLAAYKLSVKRFEQVDIK